ncbi:MAG: DUF2293 domain-containing protein [Planctomycetes bacterium]|nr:DUF2293 domain-containing protein [Planctomycetota bacterium]
MTSLCKEVRPSGRDRVVLDGQGAELRVPSDWILVPPGDPALTRRIKAGGPCWLVQEKKGRRTFSKGLWADGKRVTQIQRDLAAEREDPAYQKRLHAGRQRRERAQVAYAADFEAEVRAFLAFDPRFADLQARLARAVAAHATPVGSGTVARTQRIPVAERASAAVIAWMRHATTGYDNMVIPHVRGRRREVRRALAQRSRELLDRYRSGQTPDVHCPLAKAIAKTKP